MEGQWKYGSPLTEWFMEDANLSRASFTRLSGSAIRQMLYFATAPADCVRNPHVSAPKTNLLNPRAKHGQEIFYYLD